MSSLFAVRASSSRTVPSRLLAGLARSTAHNCFDVHSQESDAQFGLAVDLLWLLPEDLHDRQPIWAADRSCCLAADVRLDNRQDLIRLLGLTEPETLADSAILLAAWQRWGEACLDWITGGFAFAVWTPSRQELFAARDHAGERPLHYFHGAEFFALATMPKPLLALPGVSARLNETRLIDAFVLGKPDKTQTFFADVTRLPQGHLLRVTPAGLTVRRYWHPNDAKPIRFKRDSDYTEALLEVFDRATAGRLRTNAGIGSQLSAGFDSTSVTASAALLLAREGKSLTAFTAVPRAGFSGKAPFGRLPDEGPGAAAVAALYPNVEHVRYDSAGEDLLAATYAVSDAVDEPVSNPVNGVWLTKMNRLARERGINTVLMGVNGNATISYFGYEALNLWFRQGRWLHLALAAYRMRQNGRISMRRAVSEATRGVLPPWLQQWLTPEARTFDFSYSAAKPALLGDPALRRRMMDDFFSNSRTLAEERADFFERVDHGPYNAAYRSLTGVDSRDPSGDKRVYEFCYAIPIEQYVVGNTTRSLVRRAMKDRLPADLLARGTRGIQGADWYMTVGDALPAMRQALPALKRSETVERLLDVPRIEHLLQTFPTGDYDHLDNWFKYGDSLCRGYSYGYFLSRDHAAVARGELLPAPWPPASGPAAPVAATAPSAPEAVSTSPAD